MSRVILMGDPTHFSVVGGANPHTRDRYGRKKTVDRALAIEQWQGMRDRMRGLGLRVEVVPPDPALPGLVYPANAGFRLAEDFVLSNLTPTRAGEREVYRHVIEGLGIRCHTIRSRFEGEADLFPAGEFYLFTHGRVRRQHFVPRIGWPPWKRVYGFRTDPLAVEEIQTIHPLDRVVLPAGLIDEAYYHGDTCLCSFGPHRGSVLAHLPALESRAREALRRAFGERLIALSEPDATIYAANSFAFERDGEHFLIMPEGVSARLVSEVRSHRVTVVQVDVSEFYKKGGGSVKCMIGDLGMVG